MNVVSLIWGLRDQNSLGANILPMAIQFGNSWIEGLGNNELLIRFSSSRVSHLRCMLLDHIPLIINLTGLEAPPRKKVFRFEDIWLSDT